jgi:hypothetical protein
MKHKFYILILMTLAAAFNARSQQTGIKGYVFDSQNNSPLAGATISVLPGNMQVTANETGFFEAASIPAGAFSIITSYIGYAPDTLLVTEGSRAPQYRIGLRPAGLQLAMVTVAAKDNIHQNKIAAVDLLLRPLNSAQDILKTVPGLFIAQHAGGGKAEQIFLRGYDIDHGTDINITVDGLPVNMISHAHGQGYADLHFLIPETVDKINFDKGPYRADKGNLATAGYVDFKTKDFISGNSVKLEAGLFSSRRASGMLKLLNTSKENKREQLYVAGELFTNDGYFESSQNFKRTNLLTKYNLIHNNNTRITALASVFNSKWNASGQIPERAVAEGIIKRLGAIDNREGGSTARYNASLQLQRQLSNHWQLQSQLFYTHYRFSLFSNFTFFLQDSVNGDMINQKEERDILGGHLRLSKTWRRGGVQLRTEAGAGLRYDDVSNIELSKAPQRVFLAAIQKGSIREANAHAFISQHIDITEKLDINPSLRFDYFNFGYLNRLTAPAGWQYQNRGIISPKLNISYALSGKSRLFLNNGFGFHSNDTRVILNKDAGKILPRVFGTDLGISLKPAPGLFIKAALWHLYSQQEFVYVGDAGIVEPAGRSRRLGADVMVRWQLNKWLFADLDVNLSRARSLDEAKGANYIPLAPAFTSIGGVSAKLSNGLNASLRYRLLDNRPANEDYSLTATGYFLTDAVVNYEWKRFQFSLSAENIFNRHWKEAQFETTSRLRSESDPVSEIHYTPGTPFFMKAGVMVKF